MWSNLSVRVTNRSGRPRQVSVVPYFPFGYMWMNQSVEYRVDLGGVVASSITPYQKGCRPLQEPAPRDKTLLPVRACTGCPGKLRKPRSRRRGLHALRSLVAPLLANGDARYETPAAAVQYRLTLALRKARPLPSFGPALDDAEIAQVRATPT